MSSPSLCRTAVATPSLRLPRRAQRRTRCDSGSAHPDRGVQARPVARAAFFATRLSPAPVFRTALFADFMAFVVLDFLRLAFFMIPPVPRFVQLGSFLDSCQAPAVILAAAAHLLPGRSDAFGSERVHSGALRGVRGGCTADRACIYSFACAICPSERREKDQGELKREDSPRRSLSQIPECYGANSNGFCS